MAGARRLAGLLAAHWNNPEYADAEALVVVPSPWPCSDGGGAATAAPGDAGVMIVAARFPVHRLVLTAASPYFAAVFERWRRDGGGGESPGGAPPLPQCVLHVGCAAEVEAGVALLRCCYVGAFDGHAAADCAAADAAALAALAAPRGAALPGASPPPGHGDGEPPLPSPPPPCWQQLAVRTLVLADRLGCAGVVDACVEALSGTLFAHQMSLDAALAVLWLLPEPLARQEAVAPLQRMALVRVVQEFGELEPALADPARAARLQQLPAEAMAALLRSPELSVWGEGAALAALDVWASGPAGRAATAEQLTAIGASVRLPLVAGPLLAAAAALMPEAAFAEWPLEALQRYYGASLDARYDMTHTLLESGQSVPWSSVRRLRTADEALAAIRGGAHLSQLRRLYEATCAADDCGVGGGAVPALLLGTAAFGGLSWRAELVCCLLPPEEAGAGAGAGAEAEAAGSEPAPGSAAGAPPVRDAPVGAAARWRLGLRVVSAPLLGMAGGDSSPPPAARPPYGARGAQLFATGAAKTAAALARHCDPSVSAVAEAAAAAPAAPGGGSGHAAAGALGFGDAAAFDLAVGVRAQVGETSEALDAAAAAGAPGAFSPLALREACGGGAWCMRAGRGPGGAAALCGLCRRGVLPAPLPRAPGEPEAALPPVFVGWQPALWSRLAPGGQLHWHCALRVLTDY
ncbi:hypothetical protein Rsub_01200 [Raphidocelis subcapitata]|uniref:BTB domain-containing protein n=1 Tax=Raphidocelis subcapitata TaxID=307507 RepID=A0A2V0NU83_9CHLO|nr:hypothetical protein Rsub_01200 [Raphidocelis subcapitata]|eukprot:GBF88487.1 hypothetical protein Rsub_01200 [Raphidocelis subcapitata]